MPMRPELLGRSQTIQVLLAEWRSHSVILRGSRESPKAPKRWWPSRGISPFAGQRVLDP